MSADWNSSNVIVESSLSDQVQDRMRGVGAALEFSSGERVYREGENHAYLYLVQSGRFALSRIGKSGRRGTFWIVGEGGSFGLCTALLNEPVSCDCECIEAGRAVRVERAALATMIDDDVEARWAVLESLSKRIKLHSLALHEERMLPLPVRLGRRLMQASGAGNEVKLSHSDLADFVGASRYAVGKVLRSFQADGYVQIRYGSIEIADRQGISNYLSMQSDLG
ncbi:MAG: Crp/Fnr family transcriptional regulator [Pseudomonadota bacterium]